VLRSLLIDATGSALIQFALILPPFLMMMFGVAEVGRVLWLQNAMHYAVQQAARCAAINTTTCSAANVGSYAAGASGANVPAAAFTLTSPDPSCGRQVKGQYAVRLNIPYYKATWTLNAQACFPTSS
jgi:Flp pilus assembly protein TadG